MPDWEKRVRERFAGCRKGGEIDSEVVAELAGHLEDVCDAWMRRGFSEGESVQRAWEEVADWAHLARRIALARKGDEMMNTRIRALWIPGVVMMTLAMGILYAGLRAGILPRIIWLTPRIALLLYLPWLLILPVIGALAAYWSRMQGGSLRFRIAASLFPAVAMVFVLFLILPVAIFVDRHVPRASFFIAFASNLVGWVIIPGAALLLGALPFLKEKSAGASLQSAGA